MRRLLFAPLAVLLVAGCQIADPPGPAAPTAVSGAVSGGALRVGITAPEGVDPTSAYGPASKLVVSTMCDTLVTLNPDTGAVEPGLAKSWEVRNDTITFKLRPGLRFTDGTAVKSSDVAFSLTRLASQVEAPYTASLLAPVKGSSAENADLTGGFDSSKDLAGVTTPNSSTVGVGLSTPAPELLRVFAEPATAPISKKAYLANPLAFAHQPVCVGPYAQAKPYYPGDTSIVLNRSRYDGASHGFTDGGKGYADSVSFAIFPDQTAAYSAYSGGMVDAVDIPAASVPTARMTYPTQIVSSPTRTIEYVGLPVSVPALKSQLVREALSAAIDRTALVSSVWNDTRLPATSILPGSVGGSHDCTVSPVADLGLAKSLLTQARQSVGQAVDGGVTAADLDLAGQTWKFYVDADGEGTAEAAAIADDWQRAFGVRITVMTLPAAQWLSTGTTGAGFDGPFRLSWAGAYYSPQAYLGPLYVTNQTTVGNLAHYSDRGFDTALTDSTIGVGDDRLRASAFGKLVQKECLDLPLLPLAQDENFWLLGRDVHSARDRALSVDSSLLLRELYLR